MKVKTIEANNKKFARLKELYERVMEARAILMAVNGRPADDVFMADVRINIPEIDGAPAYEFAIELSKPMIQQQAVYMVMHAERDFKEAGGEL